MTQISPARSRPRIALYSHDACGLGHIRRNLALAHALARLDPRPDVLLLSGADEAGAFARPAGCDLVGLPGITKSTDGSYDARHLHAELADVVDLRRSILTAALDRFAPDLLIVDKHPRGAFGELEPALGHLAARGSAVVLGLRDVLDDPLVAAAEWARAGGSDALERWYAGVWVYGDPSVCDPTTDLNLPPRLRGRVDYVGYLARGREDATGGQVAQLPVDQLPADQPPVDQPYVLGLAGGGGDGADLADAFTTARFPPAVHGVFVAGPHLPEDVRRRLHRRAAGRSDLAVFDFTTDLLSLLARASEVVAMGGYNTVAEVLCHSAPALIVPRVRPRTEQLIRAEAMAAAGHADLLHPDRLSPEALSAWMAGALTRAPLPRHGIDLDGLAKIPTLAALHCTGKELARVAG